MGGMDTQLAGAAIVSSGLVIALSLVMIGVLFQDINSMYDDIMLDMAEFKVIANDAWKDIAVVNHRAPSSDFDQLFARQKRDAKACNCAQRSRRCPVGAPGPKGAPGEAGANGADGLAGLVGKSGLIETARSPPGSCIKCPPGPPGPMGPQGIQGPAGPNGFIGAPGIDGKPGQQGPSGQVGDSGSPGKCIFDALVWAQNVRNKRKIRTIP
ncbi:unnamed protein product [Anisakis simplex]|uniref:Col_cuticle_N domain-containing protein n=1 Tax=Anisakis simplex TaxID=6269 RepID=A0A0M3KDE7_ANISI|nr:unnamed protein product [Anisakis simplex]